jgi:hypothetical protein
MATIAGIGIVLFLSAYFLRVPTDKPSNLSEKSPEEYRIKTDAFPGNAFLPQSPSSGNGNGATDNPPIAHKDPGAPESIIDNFAPSLRAIQDRITDYMLETNSDSGTLILPQVLDKEVSIDSSGIRTSREYLSYFSTHYRDIVFDDVRLDNTIKDENKIPLLPVQLAERVLGSGDISDVRDSLLIFKDFIKAKTSYEAGIKVYGEALVLNKRVIAFDKLTIDLIDKAIVTADGVGSKDDLKIFLQRFVATASREHDTLKNQVGYSITDNPLADTFKEALAFLGVNKAFAALAVHFGGLTTIVIPCPCSAGTLVTVGPPIPAQLFVSIAWAATPAFFPFKALHPGAWWLGLYEPAPFPCLIFGIPPAGCVPIGAGAPPIIAGTSI